MRFSYWFRLLILLAIISLYNNTSALAQMDVYLKKPEKNIYKVVAKSEISGYDNDTIRVFEYDTNGLLISERIPSAYVSVDYRYDTKNRLIEKEAFYGESSSNGTTTYSYSGDTVFEVSHLYSSFHKKNTILLKNGLPSSSMAWIAESFSDNSRIEITNYDYSSSGRLNKIFVKTIYYKFETDPESLFEMDEDELIEKLQSSKTLKCMNIHTIFKYKDTSIVSQITYNSDTRKKTIERSNSFDKQNRILRKCEVIYTYPEIRKFKCKPVKTETIWTYRYDINGDLVEIQQKTGNNLSTGYYKNGKLYKETETNKGSNKELLIVKYEYIFYK